MLGLSAEGNKEHSVSWQTVWPPVEPQQGERIAAFVDPVDGQA